MKKRLMSLVLCLVMVFSLFPAMSASVDAADEHYISTWHESMLNLNAGRIEDSDYGTALNLSTFLSSQATYRLSVPITVGGQDFKATLTNYFGSRNLTVSRMTVGLLGSGALNSMNESSMVEVGRNISVPMGGTKTVSFHMRSKVPSGSTLIVNLCLSADDFKAVKDAALTGAVAWAAAGDVCADGRVNAITSLKKLSQEDPNTGDYNTVPMLTNISVMTSDPDAYTTVVIGDSTVTNSIPSLLYSKLISEGVGNVAVVSSAIKGNELLKEGQGYNEGPLEGAALRDRFQMDALNVDGVKKIFVMVGANDIIHPHCSNLAQYYDHYVTAEEITATYTQLAQAAHSAGAEIYFLGITPFYGYTRENTVNVDQSMEDTRTQVNEWLNLNKQIDESESKYGRDLGTTFGYLQIPDDDIGIVRDESFYQLKNGSANGADADYTTDYIHFTNEGQRNVVSHIPITVFKEPFNENWSSKRIDNLFVAVSNASPDGTNYLIASHAGQNSNNIEDQQSNVKLCESNNITENPQIYIPLIQDGYGAFYHTPIVGLSDISETLQRGTDGAPYIAINRKNLTTKMGGGLYQSAAWKYYSGNNNTDNRWQNLKTSRYLAWYYPTNISTDIHMAEFDIDDRTDTPTSAASIPYSSKWYTMNTLGTDANYPYLFKVHYGSVTGIAGNKYLTYSDSIRNVAPGIDHASDYPLDGFHFRARNDEEIPFNYNTHGVALLTSGTGTTNLSVTSGAEQVFYKEPAGAMAGDVQFSLQSTLAGAAYTDTFTAGNGSVLPIGTAGIFSGYTYGTNRDLVCESSDDTIVSFDKDSNRLIFGGAYGTATLTWTFSWYELDGEGGNGALGTQYLLTVQTTVTNVGYECDIEMPAGSGAYPDEYTFESDSDVGSINVEAKLMSSVPADYELPAGGAWVWTVEGDAATVTANGASATISRSSTVEGVATVIATYKVADKEYCSSAVTIMNRLNAIDILVGGPEGESLTHYTMPNADINDTVDLFAKSLRETLPAGGTWTWASSNPDVISVSSENDDANAVATVTGYGNSTVTAFYSYELDDGTQIVLVDSVVIHVKQTVEKNFVIAFGAKHLLESDVYDVDTKVEQFGVFDLSAQPGDLTFTPNWEKGAKTHDLTAFAAVSAANYYKNAPKTSVETECFKANVIPASAIYFSDSLDGKTLTPNDQIGYNSEVTYAEPDAQSGTFTFTFTGSRIDLYCTVTNDSGSIIAKLTNNGTTQSKIIKMTVPEAANAIRVSSPSVSFSGLSGESTLQIIASNTADFKLEGIRVYNANSANADVEPNARYINLRDVILSKAAANELKEKNTEETGAFFFDGYDPESAEGWKIEDYKNNGPKNEVYLTAGQAVAFTVPKNTEVMVSVRAPEDIGGTIKINNADTIDVTNVDMYYPVTVDSEDNSVLIANDGTSTISIVNVKLTGAAPVEPGKSALKASPKLLSFASRVMTEEVQESPAPVETSEPTGTPSLQSLLQQLISNFVRSLFSSISRLFGH